MKSFMFTSCAGVFVFDDQGRLKKKRVFSTSEALKYEHAIREGMWIQPELELLKGVEVFLGFKKEKKVNCSQDVRKLEMAFGVVRQFLKQINTAISEQDYRGSYSEDIVIIHTIRAYEELERVINALVMRLRDFAQLVEVGAEAIPKQHGGKLLGYPVKPGHIQVFREFSRTVEGLRHQQASLERHIETTMRRVCPNLLGVAGPTLGAGLLSIAGSLKQLARMPYSKLQILGAEKAMFRHVTRGTKTPKHGIIINHEMVASAKHKGRAARALAEKLSMAARIDYFKGKDISKQLMEDLRKKLR